MDGGVRELTFLFTDIEGSTALFQRLGDQYVEVLGVHHALMRAAIDLHGGTEIQTEGDAFFVTFDEPASAVACCLEMQLSLAGCDWPHGDPVHVRMGMHHGAVTVTSKSEFVGIAVHEAARIASSAHGGQVVLSDVVADLSRAAMPENAELVDLGRHALKDFPDPRQLFQLTHPAVRKTFPPLRSLTATVHNLAKPPTILIGRDADVAVVVERFTSGDRLVTITGEGGLGKTRLALECAWQLLSWFRDGAWFVDLATEADPYRIPLALADALGVEIGAVDPIDAVVAHIGQRSMLIVADNLEHLLEGVTLLSDLLARCPNLRILATSRERLRLRGECRYALEPLSTPDTDTPAELQSSATARMFIERARALGIEVDLYGHDAAHLGSICRQLDGLPLAVELAAARLDEFSLAEIAVRLETSVELLSKGDRDMPPRQRALHTALAWSEDLLADGDRQVFRACSTFRGSFDASAGAAVAGVAPEVGATSIRRLISAGLVRRYELGKSPEPRWYLLVPVRQYALAALEYEGLAPVVLARFVDVMRAKAEAEAPLLVTAGQSEALDRLQDDHQNLVAAFDHADDGDAARIGAALHRYFNYRGHWRLGLSLLSRAWETGGGDGETHTSVGIGLATLQFHLRALGDADFTLNALVAGPAPLGDEATAIVHNLQAGVVLELAGDDPDPESMSRASAHLDAAEAAAARVGEPRLAALVQHSRAALTHRAGSFDAAAAQYEALAELWHVVGDLNAESLARFNVATCLHDAGRFDEAVVGALVALDSARAFDSRHAEVIALELLAKLACETGDSRGRVWAEQGSELAEVLGSPGRRFATAYLADHFCELDADSGARLVFLERVVRAAKEIDLDEHAAAGEAVLSQLLATSD